METLLLDKEELDNIIYISAYLSIPEVQPKSDMVVGCKGCEGGCAAEICAK